MLWRTLAIVILLTIAVGVFVEHTLTNVQIRTIASARSADVTGGTVAIEGTVTYAKNNRFVVQDGTGRAELTTCPLWYKRINLHEGDKVVVVGEVLNNPPLARNCDFVMSTYKIFRDKDIIEVRRGPGKPPWAFYHRGTAAGY